jgi:hypothetical protein
MPIKPELKEWLDRLPLKDEVKSILNGELEKDEVQTKFFETMVPRSEYSKTLNAKDQEVAAQRQQLEVDQRAAQAAKQSYDTFKASEEKRVQKFYADANAQLAAEQAQRKAYERRLGELVAQNLITQEEATVAKQEFVPQAPVPPVAPEGRKYVTEDKLLEAVGTTQTQYVHAIAKINDIADAHFDLFGVRLNRQELVDKTLQLSKTNPGVKVEQVWAETYKVQEKQAELAKQAEESRIKAAVDEALVRDRSERAIAGDNAPYSGLDDPITGHKHILSIFSEKDGRSRGLGVSPTVAKAAEAYRQKQASGSAGKTG